jgi:hypothetical protein
MAADSELLLTEYLLNFEDQNDNECSFETEGFSSGVECSDDEDACSLYSLKETLKTTPKKGAVEQSTRKSTTARSSRSNKLVQKKTVDKIEARRLRMVEYRRRKSKQAKTTEAECQQLKETNKALNEKNIELDRKVSFLEKQIEYLEKVLTNGSVLSTVLGSIAKNAGVVFNNNPVLPANSLKRKRTDGVNDENEPEMKKSSGAKESSGGVCLHLTPGGMSLEFCRECDVNATAAE